jgi:tRNA threonylcarbamoyladenosine biosynthesis protein TsaE
MTDQPTQATLHLTTKSEQATEEVGARLAALLEPGDVVALVGELGAGKTCLARGIARGLGIDEPVTSPTFILVAEYRTPAGVPLYHADCYRLDAPAAEAVDIGLDELMEGRGVCVVEWAERVAGLLPPDHLRIELVATDDSTRDLAIHATGPRSATLVHRLAAEKDHVTRP